MVKSSATVKVDTEENWAKAKNYIPDVFTIIVYQFSDGRQPGVKMGDGVHTVGELNFMNEKKLDGSTLIL